jgi:hypothetical protein
MRRALTKRAFSSRKCIKAGGKKYVQSMSTDKSTARLPVQAFRTAGLLLVDSLAMPHLQAMVISVVGAGDYVVVRQSGECQAHGYTVATPK